MTYTLYIGNDITTAEPVQIFCEDDFVRLVDERLGRDASKYVKDLFEQRDNAINDCDELLCQQYYLAGYDEGYADGVIDAEKR